MSPIFEEFGKIINSLDSLGKKMVQASGFISLGFLNWFYNLWVLNYLSEIFFSLKVYTLTLFN